MTIAAEWGTGQVFWSMVWFSIFFIWVVLIVTVFRDVFRRNDLSGWGKALWVLFVIVLPYIGVFVYLVADTGFRSSAVKPGPPGPTAIA
jgi:hypothetical protein